MAESTRRVDLRLTIPVAAPYPDIARDLALKFAEYAGLSPTSTAHMTGAIAGAIAAAPRGRTSIAFLLSADDGDVTVTVTPPD
jgi:hypothetical protein